jgi:electron transfer flavoprotein alpha subunit
MSDVLVISCPTTSTPSRSDLAAIGFARQVAEPLGAACDCLVLGPLASEVAAELAKYPLRKVLVADHADLANPTGEARATAIATVARDGGYRLLAAANGTASRDCLPRVAARLGAPMASDVIALGQVTADSLAVTKPAYSGNLMADVLLTGATAVAICRPSAFEPPPAGDASAEVQTVELPASLGHARKRFVELQKTELERPELTEADVIVTGGRGTKGDFTLLEQLADQLGAAIGATRAVVDSGWMPNDFQVGQTGKVVAPKLYIACGVSGAIQHLAGMRNSKTIVAINKDPNAPIFEVADYGLVADLFEAVPVLTEAVKASSK